MKMPVPEPAILSVDCGRSILKLHDYVDSWNTKLSIILLIFTMLYVPRTRKRKCPATIADLDSYCMHSSMILTLNGSFGAKLGLKVDG